YRHDGETPGRVRLIGERDPRRARLDPLHVRLRTGDTFGIDGDEPPAVECLVTRREHFEVAVHPVRVVRLPEDGNHTQRDEEPRGKRVAEERGGGEIVHLPREDNPHEQRVDQVVRMVDAEEHRTDARYPLGVPDLDALEEEPDPESREQPDDGIEGIHYGSSPRRSLPTRRPHPPLPAAHPTPPPRAPPGP